MNNSISKIPKIGVISVTDAPREQGLVEEREQYMLAKNQNWTI